MGVDSLLPPLRLLLFALSVYGLLHLPACLCAPLGSSGHHHLSHTQPGEQEDAANMRFRQCCESKRLLESDVSGEFWRKLCAYTVPTTELVLRLRTVRNSTELDSYTQCLNGGAGVRECCAARLVGGLH